MSVHRSYMYESRQKFNNKSKKNRIIYKNICHIPTDINDAKMILLNYVRTQKNSQKNRKDQCHI